MASNVRGIPDAPLLPSSWQSVGNVLLYVVAARER
jgi:hypothetical protein